MEETGRSRLLGHPALLRRQLHVVAIEQPQHLVKVLDNHELVTLELQCCVFLEVTFLVEAVFVAAGELGAM